MKDYKLDQEEQQILDDIEKGKYKSIPHVRENGTPYQTFIASILHQYANDKIDVRL